MKFKSFKGGFFSALVVLALLSFFIPLDRLFLGLVVFGFWAYSELFDYFFSKKKDDEVYGK